MFLTPVPLMYEPDGIHAAARKQFHHRIVLNP